MDIGVDLSKEWVWQRRSQGEDAIDSKKEIALIPFNRDIQAQEETIRFFESGTVISYEQSIDVHFI